MLFNKLHIIYDSTNTDTRYNIMSRARVTQRIQTADKQSVPTATTTAITEQHRPKTLKHSLPSDSSSSNIFTLPLTASSSPLSLSLSLCQAIIIVLQARKRIPLLLLLRSRAGREKPEACFRKMIFRFSPPRRKSRLHVSM